MADVTKREVIARAPAKVMLAGEYAVLAGGRALAVTLDCWLTARLRQVAGEGITVRSNLWRTAQHIAAGADLQELRGTPLLHAVAEAAKRYGIERAELSIESTIDVSHGIGSSSALRLAVAMAMAEAHRSWTLAAPARVHPEERSDEGSRPNYTDCFSESPSHDGRDATDAFADATWGAARLAVALQREAQGGASGYDVATQLVGGLVSFTGSDDLSMWPGRIHAFEGASLARLAQLVHVYVGGAGSATAPIMRTTRAWLAAQGVWDAFIERSDELVARFIDATAAPNDDLVLKRLYHACASHRALLRSSPSYPRVLEGAMLELPGLDERFTWKTTGAGGEDAIILIGPASELAGADEALRALGRRPLDCMFTASGAATETIEESVQSGGHEAQGRSERPGRTLSP